MNGKISDFVCAIEWHGYETLNMKVMISFVLFKPVKFGSRERLRY